MQEITTDTLAEVRSWGEEPWQRFWYALGERLWGGLELAQAVRLCLEDGRREESVRTAPCEDWRRCSRCGTDVLFRCYGKGSRTQLVDRRARIHVCG